MRAQSCPVEHIAHEWKSPAASLGSVNITRVLRLSCGLPNRRSVFCRSNSRPRFMSRSIAAAGRAPPMDVRLMEGLGVTVEGTTHAFDCFKAVTSISIRIRGSARPAEIIMAAGRTSPKYLRSTGQHSGNSAPFGST